MENLNKYYQVVERCLSGLGVDPLQCRGKKPGSWTIQKGSVQVWIDVWYIDREKRSYIQVMAPIMQMPSQKQDEFFKELLQINDRLFGVGFTLYKETIWLKHIRETENLQDSEIVSTINRVANYADQYDEVLKQKYEVARTDDVTIGGSRAPL